VPCVRKGHGWGAEEMKYGFPAEDYASAQRQHPHAGNPRVLRAPKECLRCFAPPKARRTGTGFDCACPACGHTWFEEFPRVEKQGVGGYKEED